MAKIRSNVPSKCDEKTIIPEDEQWRLIQQSGVLNKIKVDRVAKDSKAEVDEAESLADEIFNASVVIMPMTFFLIMMDILIHHQYAKQPDVREIGSRLLNTFPIMSIFMFYTIRQKQNIYMQMALFLLSLGVGPRMIWLINRGSWLTNIAQCPQFATIWLYTVIQLNLPFAVLSLVLIGAWTWLAGLKLLL